jgi:hypothetical protein
MMQKISSFVILLLFLALVLPSIIAAEQPNGNKNTDEQLSLSPSKTDHSWMTVLDTTIESGPKDAGFGCAELIESDLSQAGFKIGDRQAIRWLLEERNLQTQGYLQINEKSLAQLTHVDYWIQPTIQKTQSDGLSLRLECIEVKTGLKLFSVNQQGRYPSEWSKVIEGATQALMEGLRKNIQINSPSVKVKPISRNPEARLAYYAAMEHLNRQENQAFVSALESALSIDAKFVVAAKWLSSFYREKGFDEHAEIIDKYFLKSKKEQIQTHDAMKTLVLLWSGDMAETERSWIESIFQKVLNTKIMHLESVSQGNRERDLELSGYMENYKSIYRQETRPDLVLMVGKDDSKELLSMKLMDAGSGRIIHKYSLQSEALQDSEELIRKAFTEEQANIGETEQTDGDPLKSSSGDVFSKDATMLELWFWSEKYRSGTNFIFKIRGAWCKLIMQRATQIKDKEIAGRWHAMALRSADSSAVSSSGKYGKGTTQDGMKPSQMALNLRELYPNCTSSVLMDYEIAQELAMEGQYAEAAEKCEAARSNILELFTKGLSFSEVQIANIAFCSAYFFERAGDKAQAEKILSEVQDILSKNKNYREAEMIGRFEWLIDRNGRWYLTYRPGGQVLCVQSMKAGKKSSLWREGTTLGMEVTDLESRLRQPIQVVKPIQTYDQMLEDALKIGFVEKGKLHVECVEHLIDLSRGGEYPEYLWTQVAWMNLFLDKGNKELMALNLQLRSLVKTPMDRWHCMLATGDQEVISNITPKEILSMESKDAIVWLKILSAWDWHGPSSKRIEQISIELYSKFSLSHAHIQYKTDILNVLLDHRRGETMAKLLESDYQKGNDEVRAWSAFWLGLAQQNSQDRFQSSEYFREAWDLCKEQKNDISNNLQRLRHFAGYEFVWIKSQPTKMLNERRWMFWIAALRHTSTSGQFMKTHLKKYRPDDVPMIIQLIHNPYVRREVGAKLCIPFINFNDIPNDQFNIFSSILYPDPIYNGAAGNGVLALLRNKDRGRVLMPILILASCDPTGQLSGNSSYAIDQLKHIAVKSDLPTIVELLNHNEQAAKNTAIKVLMTSAKHYGLQLPKENMTISDWQQFSFPDN